MISTTNFLHPNLHPCIKDGDTLRGRLGKRYHPSKGLLEAVNVALLLERPLLLTGETGCGKTDFAWAVANALGNLLNDSPEQKILLEAYVRSDSLAKDLLYSYDSVRRFGDANHGGKESLKCADDVRHYIELQPLGIALSSLHRRVVLIDEIDKAPRDLPNDLLRELEQNSFDILEIPRDVLYEKKVFSHNIPLYREMKRPVGKNNKPLPAPLIIITSNVERQLPDPFLRRCIFYNIEFPDESSLNKILKDHFPDFVDQKFFTTVQDFFANLRKTPGLTKVPGTAELLDWMTSLRQVYHPEYVKSHFSSSRHPRWDELPGLSCLVKLREDEIRLFSKQMNIK
jgi:MoxR-like ATPase